MARIAGALGMVELLVGVIMVAATNAEGWFGGLAFAAMYAVPLLLLALALASRNPVWRNAAGWVALVLGALYAGVLAGNWTGYTLAQAVAAIAITVPTVVVDVMIFWTEVVRGRRPGVSAQTR